MNVPLIASWFTDSYYGTGLTRFYSLFTSPAIEASSEYRVQSRITSPATLSNFGVRWMANSRSDDTPFRTRVNAGNGNQLVTVPTGTTAGYQEDTTNTDSLDDGEDWCGNVVVGAGTGTITPQVVTSLLSPTTGTFTRISTLSTGYTPSVDTALPMSAANNGATIGALTEAYCQHTVGASFTLRNFFANVDSNSRTDATQLRTRVNGGTGNIVVNYNAAATGITEDTTNTDSLVDGDKVSLFFDNAGGTGTLRCRVNTIEFAGTDAFVLLASTDPASPNDTRFEAGTTTYFFPAGSCGGAWQANATLATEENIKCRVHVAFSWSHLYCHISAFSTNGTYTHLHSRINGAEGNLLVSISGMGEYSDLTHTDTVADGDDIDLQMQRDGSAGSMTLRTVSSLGVAAGSSPTTPPNLRLSRRLRWR